MQKEKTELVFIIDKSGSMAGLENDTIGGYNRLLKEQKKLKGECIVTTIFFNTRIELIHDRTLLTDIATLKREEYRPGGGTALLDALGYGINKTAVMLSGTKKSERPQNIIVVIITDGEENSSREYSQQKINSLVKSREKEGWIFQFLGANIDTFATADSLGINRKFSHSFEASEEGVNVMYSKVSNMVSSARKGKKQLYSLLSLKNDLSEAVFLLKTMINPNL